MFRLMMRGFKKKEKGFTLIELIIVIAIIGILAAVLLPKFGGFKDAANKSNALAEAKSAQTAVLAYYASNSSTYPAEGAASPYFSSLATSLDVSVCNKIFDSTSSGATVSPGDGVFTYSDGTYHFTWTESGKITETSTKPTR